MEHLSATGHGSFVVLKNNARIDKGKLIFCYYYDVELDVTVFKYVSQYSATLIDIHLEITPFLLPYVTTWVTSFHLKCRILLKQTGNVF